MVWAAAPRASPSAISAAAAARQPIEEAGCMSVPPARASRPRLPLLFAPPYHAPVRREGRRGRAPPWPIAFDSERAAIGALPQPNSGVPEFGWGRDGEGGIWC